MTKSVLGNDGRPATGTRIVVQTDGTVYTVGPKGGVRWVATLSARELMSLGQDAQRAALILRPEIRPDLSRYSA